ncbi:hypothetical protein M9980_09205 [Sphingomonas donggukensis]|uniref:Uncharacterized protein n=1 Tax=Sphingomonas donggukensis TaxID=2949093 RepID=A0ABY4TW42_9SPHN|nr:hypothetical protein [Sphingomonas donggukensis]URW74751.1 hypothetical protein M9980_09205 [Sphingomonas donggukensis]
MPHDISHLPASPVWYEPCGTGDTRDAVQRWQALLDARLIGNILPTPPEVAAQREANDALFRRRAADYARACREYGL